MKAFYFLLLFIKPLSMNKHIIYEFLKIIKKNESIFENFDKLDITVQQFMLQF
jgi:hypothetical protein